MKQVSLIAAAVLALATLPAMAEDDSDYIPAETEQTYLAKDYLIGANVYDAEGKVIGDVEDVLLEEGEDQDTIVGLLVGVGGFLGVGEKKIAVKYDSFDFTEKDGKSRITLDVTKQDLQAAPEFKRSTKKKTLFERAKEKVQELKDKSEETAKDAYEKAKPEIDKAKEKASEAYDKAKEAVGGAIDSAKKAVSPEEAPAEK